MPFCQRCYAQNFSSWGYMLADSAKRDLPRKKIRFKVADFVEATNSDLPNEVHVNHTMCVSLYIYIIYIHIMFRLRPCCSHFLKKDGILINHNPWLRKRTNELYKRRHCFVKVCCDSSQKHLQAKKSKSQACSGN